MLRNYISVFIAAFAAGVSLLSSACQGSYMNCNYYGGTMGYMCVINSGDFQMGCNTSVDDECFTDEFPYHTVNTPEYMIDTYEVTVGQYNVCMNSGGTDGGAGCTAPGTGSNCNWSVNGREDNPINCVDWDQAVQFCAWAGKRLPSEAEWEKASRGNNGWKYPWGNNFIECDYAVMSLTPCSNTSTMLVGMMPQGQSPYGLQDTIGNVWEWVEDDYHIDYNGAPTDGSAWVDNPRGRYRVLRGGSWFSDLSSRLRSSFRTDDLPFRGDNTSGFRCAKSVGTSSVKSKLLEGKTGL